MAAYGSSAAATGTNGTVVITKPTSLAANDLLVAFVGDVSNKAWDTPSGWTLVTSVSVSFDSSAYLFAKVADAGDAAASDFTFTLTSPLGTEDVEGVLYRITGTFASANNIYAYSAVGGTEAVSDVFRCATGITPVVASSLLIMYIRAFCTDSDNNAISAYALQTSSPTWTERHDIQDVGPTNQIRMGTATATRTEITDTGYFEAAVSTGELAPTQSIGILLAITDTSNGTATPAVITSALAVQAPVASGGASTTVSAALGMTIAVQAPTVTGGTNDALWKNTDKPSAGSINNIDKP